MSIHDTILSQPPHTPEGDPEAVAMAERAPSAGDCLGEYHRGNARAAAVLRERAAEAPTALDQAVADWCKHRSGGPRAEQASAELAALRASHALLRRYGEALLARDEQRELQQESYASYAEADAVEGEMARRNLAFDEASVALERAALTLAAAATPGGENQ